MHGALQEVRRSVASCEDGSRVESNGRNGERPLGIHSFTRPSLLEPIIDPDGFEGHETLPFEHWPQDIDESEMGVWRDYYTG